jgi:transposase
MICPIFRGNNTPFGPRLHAVATYLKTFQALSYERLQGALSDLFGLTLSQGGLMNLLRRAQERFAEGQSAPSPLCGRGGRLRRDRRAHRGQQRLPLGLPLT